MKQDILTKLFAEELGLIIEAESPSIVDKYADSIPIYYIGQTNNEQKIRVVFKT